MSTSSRTSTSAGVRGRGSPRRGGGNRRDAGGHRSTTSSQANTDRPPSELIVAIDHLLLDVIKRR